jgi:hypothetical protein
MCASGNLRFACCGRIAPQHTALNTLGGSVQGHGSVPPSGTSSNFRCTELNARSLCPGFSGWPLNCLAITKGQGHQLHEFPRSCYVTACTMVPTGPRQLADTPCCFAVASAVMKFKCLPVQFLSAATYKKSLTQIRIMKHSAGQY